MTTVTVCVFTMRVCLHLLEAGGKIMERGCAVRTSSSLAASIITAWRVFSKTSSLMSAGTISVCGVL